jgi:hypothetical protein
MAAASGKNPGLKKLPSSMRAVALVMLIQKGARLLYKGRAKSHRP